MDIRRLRKEVEHLEGERRMFSEDEGADEEMQAGFEEFWEMQMEWSALHLVRGLEPGFTLDEAGTFWTLDGRFALSRKHMDLRGLMGPRTQEIQERIPPERWGRFLEADEEAAELLECILELAESTAVPEDKEPGHQWHEQAEIREQIGDPHGLGGTIFEDADEREATRRLTWTLIHNPDAAAMPSELTRRRDAFVTAEGTMPSHLPTE